MTIQLSAIIIARNEQGNIADCINSVQFADEVLVVDDYSDDDTADIAESLGAIVHKRSMSGDFAAQRNYAIDQANGEWLLFIDCDERITPELATEIRAKVSDKQSIAYAVRRLNHFAKQRVSYGVLRPDSVVRLLPKANVKFEGVVHERLVHPYVVQTLKQPMLHYTYASWTQYYAKFEQYTRLSAKKYHERGKSVSFILDILLRPIWAFIKMYVIHGGCLDGRLGWMLSVNHYHYTQVKYMRLYALQHYGIDSL